MRDKSKKSVPWSKWIQRISQIGDVVVVKGLPVNNNPYGEGLLGAERAQALQALRDGQDTSSYSFWCAPSCGGAFQIFSKDQIDWTLMG